MLIPVFIGFDNRFRKSSRRIFLLQIQLCLHLLQPLHQPGNSCHCFFQIQVMKNCSVGTPDFKSVKTKSLSVPVPRFGLVTVFNNRLFCISIRTIRTIASRSMAIMHSVSIQINLNGPADSLAVFILKQTKCF
jgi:hypothetical protein